MNIKNIFLSILCFLIFIVNINYSNANNENVKTINKKEIQIVGLLKGTDGTYYNYLNVALKKDDEIICKGMSRQYFSSIDNLSDGFTTDIKKVRDNGFIDFKCNRTKLLKNGKLDPNIKLVIYSDGFYKINNNSITINVNKFKIDKDRILIGDFKNKVTNFKISFENINNTLFNKYNKKNTKIKEKLIKSEQKHKELKTYAKELKGVNLEITNIPEDVKVINYQINGQKYQYKLDSPNILILKDDKVKEIKIGEIKLTNLEINSRHRVIVPYQKGFNSEKVILKIKLLNVPQITKDIIIQIDNDKFKYREDNSYELNLQQIKNGIDIIIEGKKMHIKLDKSDTLEIDYTKTIKTTLDLKKLDNNFLTIKLPLDTLDGLDRLSYFAVYSNGGNKKEIIPNKEILIDGDNVIIKHFKSINDIIPKQLLIKGKTYNLNQIGINYDDFLENKNK